MALALNILKRVDMPLSKETKANQPKLAKSYVGGLGAMVIVKRNENILVDFFGFFYLMAYQTEGFIKSQILPKLWLVGQHYCVHA